MSANAIAAIACFTIAFMWVAYAYAYHWYSQRNEKRKPQQIFGPPNPPEHEKRKAEHLLGMYYQLGDEWVRISKVNMLTMEFTFQAAYFDGRLGNHSCVYSIHELDKRPPFTFEQFTEVAARKQEELHAWQSAPPPDQEHQPDNDYFYEETTDEERML